MNAANVCGGGNMMGLVTCTGDELALGAVSYFGPVGQASDLGYRLPLELQGVDDDLFAFDAFDDDMTDAGVMYVY